MSENVSKIVTKTVLQIILEVFLSIILFLAAGTLKFWNAWLFLGSYYIPILLILTYFAIKDRALFEKRMEINEEDNPQKIFKIFLTITTIIIRSIAGFDYRYHWSTIPILFIIVFTLGMLCGIIMLFIVMKQNSYLSAVIEVQEEQKVIDYGLYSIIRHPMYLAYLIIFCFTPLVLGSFYALIPILFIPLLMVIRIINEEKVLQKGLKGYDLYIQKVKYRLIPYLW